MLFTCFRNTRLKLEDGSETYPNRKQVENAYCKTIGYPEMPADVLAVAQQAVPLLLQLWGRGAAGHQARHVQGGQRSPQGVSAPQAAGQLQPRHRGLDPGRHRGCCRGHQVCWPS